MADDQFLVDLAEATSLEMTDIIYSVINPGTVPVDRKIKISNLAASIKLDDLGAPDDNTDLNATISAHGLLPKLSGSANDALRGDGSWGQVSSGAGADGWSAISGSFAYASGSTITVPSGAASIYAVGDKLKLTQTTVKYFYIIGVADTVLTITGGSDYTLAAATITSPCYSHGGAVGFPKQFNWSSTVGASGSMTYGTLVTNVSTFVISGAILSFSVHFLGTTGGTASSFLTFTPPVPISGTGFIGVGRLDDGSSLPYFAGYTENVGDNLIYTGKLNGDNFGIGSGRRIYMRGSFTIK